LVRIVYPTTQARNKASPLENSPDRYRSEKQ